MKKRILILTFADHISEEQAKTIADTHRNATGLYSSAELATATTISVDDVINEKDLPSPKFDASEFIPSDPVLEMSKHFDHEVWAKIVANYEAQNRTVLIDFLCGLDAKSFIASAFDWRKNPDGWRYWKEIYDSLEEKGL